MKSTDYLIELNSHLFDSFLIFHVQKLQPNKIIRLIDNGHEQSIDWQ